LVQVPRDEAYTSETGGLVVLLRGSLGTFDKSSAVEGAERCLSARFCELEISHVSRVRRERQ